MTGPSRAVSEVVAALGLVPQELEVTNNSRWPPPLKTFGCRYSSVLFKVILLFKIYLFCTNRDNCVTVYSMSVCRKFCSDSVFVNVDWASDMRLCMIKLWKVTYYKFFFFHIAPSSPPKFKWVGIRIQIGSIYIPSCYPLQVGSQNETCIHTPMYTYIYTPLTLPRG